jgi:hypothetical protein
MERGARNEAGPDDRFLSWGLRMDRAHYISYLREEANHEIARLQLLLRDPAITEDEREVAQSMLDFYREAKIEELLPRCVEQERPVRRRNERDGDPHRAPAAPVGAKPSSASVSRACVAAAKARGCGTSR